MNDPEKLAEIVRLVCQPGRPGLHAAIKLIATAPRRRVVQLLPHAFAGKPSKGVSQLLLALTWVGGSPAILRAAGTSDTLEKWFRRADFGDVDLPSLRKLVNKDLAIGTVLFRGGQGDPRALAGGYSWTTDIMVASHYAFHRRVRPGPPVILRRTFTKVDELLLHAPSADGEAVLVPTDGPLKMFRREADIQQLAARASLQTSANATHYLAKVQIACRELLADLAEPAEAV